MKNIIIKPIVTEKMTPQGEKLNRYAFYVDRDANKLEIRKAVEDLYKVQVQDVNTLVASTKLKRRYTKGGAIEGHKSIYKKALVTLRTGESIDFFSSI